MDKNERIESKKSELMQSFEGLQPEQLKVATDLISQAAFMAVELEDLAETISNEGMTEVYTNGKNQSGRKISSNAKMYGSLIGKYNAIIARLLKIVPPHVDTKKESLKKHEKVAIQRQMEADAFRAAYDFVDRAENSSDTVRDQIKDIRRGGVFDVEALARIIRERGLYSE